MKKLLFLLLFISMSVEAQFWQDVPVNFPDDSVYGTISVVNENITWVLVGERTIVKTTNGGSSWSNQVIDLGLPDLTIMQIAAVNENTAYICGLEVQSLANPGVWKTTDGGVNWIKQTSIFTDLESSPCTIHFFDENNGFTMGDYIYPNYDLEIFTTSDGGMSWNQVQEINLPNISNIVENWPLWAFKIVAVGDTAWFLTQKGDVCKSIDKGLSWTVTHQPSVTLSGNNNFANLAFKNNNEGLIYGGVANEGGLFKTLDGGVTWFVVDYVGTIHGSKLVYVPGTNKLVSVGNNGSSYSLDDGDTWVNIDANSYWTTAFFNETAGYGLRRDTSGKVKGKFMAQGVISKYVGSVLNIDEFVKNDFSIFPIPTNSDVYIKTGKLVGDVTVSIYDMSGRLVYNENYHLNKDVVQLKGLRLASGAYLVKVSGEKINVTKKIEIK